MFISNNRASFHLWWKENFLKHQKVSKYYGSSCKFIIPTISWKKTYISTPLKARAHPQQNQRDITYSHLSKVLVLVMSNVNKLTMNLQQLLALFRMVSSWGKSVPLSLPTIFSPVISLKVEIDLKLFWLLVLTLLPHCWKISSPQLVPVSIYWIWTKATPKKNGLLVKKKVTINA